MVKKESGLSIGNGVKRIVLTVLFFFVCGAVSVFAADSIAELDKWGDNVIALIKSKWVTAICVLALAIEGGGMIWAGRQGESGLVKKFLPWMIGTIVLLSAQSITTFFFEAT
jgi:hypothetical protein